MSNINFNQFELDKFRYNQMFYHLNNNFKDMISIYLIIAQSKILKNLDIHQITVKHNYSAYFQTSIYLLYNSSIFQNYSVNKYYSNRHKNHYHAQIYKQSYFLQYHSTSKILFLNIELPQNLKTPLLQDKNGYFFLFPPINQNETF